MGGHLDVIRLDDAAPRCCPESGAPRGCHGMVGLANGSMMLLSFDPCFLLSSMMADYPSRCRICNTLAWNSFAWSHPVCTADTDYRFSVQHSDLALTSGSPAPAHGRRIAA